MLHNEIKSLRKAVRDLHRCKVRYIKSVSVEEIFNGETAWKGDVAIFQLHGHVKTNRCYAWSFKEGSETKRVTVLEIPPVDSPQSAVRISVASKARAG